MKKLTLKALELGTVEVLTRAQLKNVLGGVAETTTAPYCLSSFFYSGSNGCGITTCTGWAAKPGNCLCSTTITSPQPCGWA